MSPRKLPGKARIVLLFSLIVLSSSVCFAGFTLFNEDFSDTVLIDLNKSFVDINTSAGTVQLDRNWTGVSTGYDYYDEMTAGYSSPRRPSVALDSNNNPYLVWEEVYQAYSDIFFSDWNGTTWVTAGGSLGAENLTDNPSDSFSPVIALDSSDQPIVIWRDLPIYATPKIRITKWFDCGITEGEYDWCKLDGIKGYGSIVSLTRASDPSLVLDSSDNPRVAFSAGSTKNVYYTEWDPEISKWVDIDGSLGYSQVSSTSFDSTNPSIGLTSSGPVIAWQDVKSSRNEIFVSAWNGSAWKGLENTTADYDVISVEGGSNDISPALWANPSGVEVIVVWDGGTDIFFSEWDGSNWVDSEDTPGRENISNQGTSADHPSIDVDPSGLIIVVAWASGNDIRVTKYAGSGWTNFKSIPGSEEITEASAYLPEKTSIDFDSNNYPYVAWRGRPESSVKVLLSQRGGYPNNSIYSTNVASSLEGTLAAITDANISATSSTPTYTSIEYFLSNDNGSTWKAASSVSFTGYDNRLLWRADLKTSDPSVTPSLSSIDLNYSYFYRNQVTIISPNGNMVLAADNNIVFSVVDEDSNYATFEIYYDDDTSPANGRTLITDGSVNLVGGTAQETKQWSTLGVPGGLYYICIEATTDGYTSSDCSDEPNRLGTIPWESAPELYIESLSLNREVFEFEYDIVTDTVRLISEPPELTVSVNNMGGQDVGIDTCFKVGLFQVTRGGCVIIEETGEEECPEPSYVYWDDYTLCGLNSGQSKEVVFTGFKEGIEIVANQEFEMLVRVDYLDAVTEVDEENNDQTFFFYVSGPGPDLVIEELILSPDRFDREEDIGIPIHMTLKVKNQGSLAAQGNFRVTACYPTPDCGKDSEPYSPECIPKVCVPNEDNIDCICYNIGKLGESIDLFETDVIRPGETITFEQDFDPLEMLGKAIYVYKRFNINVIVDCLPRQCCGKFWGWTICGACSPLSCGGSIPEINERNNAAGASIINKIPELVQKDVNVEQVAIVLPSTREEEEPEDVKRVKEEKEIVPRPTILIKKKIAISGETQTLTIVDRNGDILANYLVKVVYPDGSERQFYTDEAGEVSFITFLSGEYKIQYGTEELSFLVKSKPIPIIISPEVTETERFLIENSFLGINLAILFVILNSLLSAIIYFSMMRVFIPIKVEEKREKRKKVLARILVSLVAFGLPIFLYYSLNFFVGFVFGLSEIIGLFLAISIKKHLDRLKAGKEKLIK